MKTKFHTNVILDWSEKRKQFQPVFFAVDNFSELF